MRCPDPNPVTAMRPTDLIQGVRPPVIWCIRPPVSRTAPSEALRAAPVQFRRRNEESTVAADKIDTIVSLSKRRGFVYPLQ